MDYNIECCPFCTKENEVPADIVVGICSHCGKRLVICSTCKNQNNCSVCTAINGMNHTEYNSGKLIAVFNNDGFSYWKIVAYEMETKESQLWWQLKGLSFTPTGYGTKIPSRKLIRFNGKWHRIYCYIKSNVGTSYIITKKYGKIVIDGI